MLISFSSSETTIVNLVWDYFGVDGQDVHPGTTFNPFFRALLKMTILSLVSDRVGTKRQDVNQQTAL